MPKLITTAYVNKKTKKVFAKVLAKDPIIARAAPLAIKILGLAVFQAAIKGFMIIRPTVIIGITLTASALLKFCYPPPLLPK